MITMTPHPEPSSSQSFLLYLSPQTPFISQINITLPASVTSDRFGYQNIRSNTLSISLSLTLATGKVLTNRYTNHNPIPLLIQYDAPITVIPFKERISCENCECIDIARSRENILQLIIHIHEEGEGIVGIPAGIATSTSGVLSDPIEFHFNYGHTMTDG